MSPRTKTGGSLARNPVVSVAIGVVCMGLGAEPAPAQVRGGAPRSGGPVEPEPVTLLVREAEARAAEGRLIEAETFYRHALRLSPRSRDLRLAMARVLLWRAQYPEAERLLHGLLRDNANDVEARELLGTSCYWSGAWREAAAQFRETLAREPDREASRRQLEAIASTMKPQYDLSALYRTDDQPYDAWQMDARIAWRSDPLTEWTAAAGCHILDAELPSDGGAATRSATVPYAQLGADAVFGRQAAGGEGWLRLVDFAEASTEPMGGGRVRIPASASVRAELEAARHELFYTASAVGEKVYVTYGELRIRMDNAAHWYGLLSARWNEYVDGNTGQAVSGYLLAPAAAAGGTAGEEALRVWVGVSAAYRDTDRTRYRAASADAQPLGAETFPDAYEGVYDPYFTPMAQVEVRGLLAAEWTMLNGVRLKVSGEYGIAEEEAIAFWPDGGLAARPAMVGASTYTRRYEPWRGGIELSTAVGKGWRWRLRWEHHEEAFYSADDIGTGLVGRF